MTEIRTIECCHSSYRFEPASRSYEQHGRSSSNDPVSSHFGTIRLKLSTNAYFVVLFHSMWSKYENSKSRFYDVITSVFCCSHANFCVVTKVPCDFYMIFMV